MAFITKVKETLRRPILSFMVGVVVGIFTPLAFFHVTAFFMGEDMRMDYAFQAIKLDMPRQEVARLMGSEGQRSDTFHLGQQAGFEFQYRTAAHIGAAYFVSLHTGVDIVFTVAFDENDKAIYKALGGT